MKNKKGISELKVILKEDDISPEPETQSFIDRLAEALGLDMKKKPKSKEEAEMPTNLLGPN